MTLKEAKTVEIGETLNYKAQKKLFKVTGKTQTGRTVIFEGYVIKEKGKYETKVFYKALERLKEKKEEAEDNE